MKKGVYMMWAVLAVSGLISVPVKAQDSITVDSGWCIGGAQLYHTESIDSSRYFSSSRTYVITAGGGDNARDIDLIILNSRGKEVVKDIKPNSGAMVTFRPSTSGTYTIRLRLSKSWDTSQPELCWFLVSADYGGWNVPSSVFFSALQRLIAGTLLPASSGFSIEPIRIYGYVMRPGESQVVDLSGLRKGQYALVAVGDDNAWDIDLEVFQNGRRVASDMLIDSLPYCQFRTTNGTASFKVIHDSGKDAAFVLVALYEK